MTSDEPEGSPSLAPVLGVPAAPDAPQTTLTLAHGCLLVVEGGQERNILTLVGPSSAAHLEISIGAEGIRLLVHGVGLSLATTGALAIEAESLSLHGKNGLALTTGGDARIDAAGKLETTGRSQHIRSARGDVRVQANDDVVLEGERIRLNS